MSLLMIDLQSEPLGKYVRLHDPHQLLLRQAVPLRLGYVLPHLELITLLNEYLHFMFIIQLLLPMKFGFARRKISGRLLLCWSWHKLCFL